jgi:hypothetical protein
MTESGCENGKAGGNGVFGIGGGGGGGSGGYAYQGPSTQSGAGGGGAGGSSYIEKRATHVKNIQGGAPPGNGRIVISW